MINYPVTLTPSGGVVLPGYASALALGYTKNKGVYRLNVTASGEWAGLAIRAFWHTPGGADPPASLVVAGLVDVPASVTARAGSGCVTFEGSDGTKTVTSADLHYRVSANSGTEEGDMPEPGTPAWQQLVDAVHTDATTAEQAKTDAQTAANAAAASAANAGQSAKQAADSLQNLKDGIASGDFKGEKGDPGPAVALDTTLTHEGEAADAKATGDAISAVKEDKLDKPANPIVGQVLRVKSIDETGKIVLETVAGGGGSGLPDGGTAGQVLVKKTDADGDVKWIDKAVVLTTPLSKTQDEMLQTYKSGPLFILDGMTLFLVNSLSGNVLYGLGAITPSGNRVIVRRATISDGLFSQVAHFLYTLPVGGTPNQILVKNSRSNGDCAWVDPQTATVRTSMDDVAVAGAKYFLGEQTALSITMPTDAQTGQEIMVVFSSGQTACTLAVDLDDFDFVPQANSMCKIVFLCVAADAWLVDAKEW